MIDAPVIGQCNGNQVSVRCVYVIKCTHDDLLSADFNQKLNFQPELLIYRCISKENQATESNRLNERVNWMSFQIFFH